MKKTPKVRNNPCALKETFHIDICSIIRSTYLPHSVKPSPFRNIQKLK